MTSDGDAGGGKGTGGDRFADNVKGGGMDAVLLLISRAESNPSDVHVSCSYDNVGVIADFEARIKATVTGKALPHFRTLRKSGSVV
jgi:hypothetical protein